jgi:hypothetical protein
LSEVFFAFSYPAESSIWRGFVKGLDSCTGSWALDSRLA